MADNGMRDANHAEEPKRFEPKKPVQLDPPKDDPITPEYLAKCNGRSSSSGRTSVTVLIQFVGTNEGYPTLVAIKVSNSTPSPTVDCATDTIDQGHRLRCHQERGLRSNGAVQG